MIPLAALLVGFLVFSAVPARARKVAGPVLPDRLPGRVRHGVLAGRTRCPRVSPLLFAALCVALPARLGLVIIGGEGAIVLAGVATGAVGLAVIGFPAPVALRAHGARRLPDRRGLDRRGRRAAALPGRERDHREPADGLYRHRADEPSGRGPAARSGQPEQALHRAAARSACASATCPGSTCIGASGSGVLACVLAWVLIDRTTWGFAARIAGGNVRAAQVQGLPVGRLIVGFSALGGVCAGLAGILRGRGRARRGQRLARGGLRFHRHPRGLSGATQPARDHPRRGALRRHRGLVAACCSGAWTCRTRRRWCCRASSSWRS